MNSATWILIAAIAFGLFVGTAHFYGLAQLRRRSVTAWKQIEIQLAVRHGLIPDLIETAREYIAHEEEVIERLLHAHHLARHADTVGGYAQAEAHFSHGLIRFFHAAERVPELHNHERKVSIEVKLKTAEEKVSFAQQYYNEISLAYNEKLSKFPGRLLAKIGRLQPRELFDLEYPVAYETATA